MTNPLPDSAVLAWWVTAWLAGHVGVDDLLDAMAEVAPAHSVRPGPGAPPDVEGAGLLPLLTVLRRTGATRLSVALPSEGDPLGLGGPRAFSVDALDAGEAVLSDQTGIGAVPHRVGAGITWTVHAVNRRSVPDVGEADRMLRQGLLRAADDLERLDVASWSHTATDEILNLRHLPEVPDVPGTPPRCRSLAARALQALAVVEAAMDDHGGAVSADEVRSRAEALRQLERCGRAALTAACSPETWPPESPGR